MKIRPLSLFITTVLMLAAGPIHTANAAKAVTSTAKKTNSESSKVPTKPLVNDFPTQARVEYVMQCMAEHGGANLDNSYHCVCAVDKIADLMNFQDYSEALTFTYMFDTPGDKGGEFRDPPKSKELRDRLKAAQKEAEACFPVIPGKITPEASEAPAGTSK
jgi:hypothetical protein